jgi:hypothetical protein
VGQIVTIFGMKRKEGIPESINIPERPLAVAMALASGRFSGAHGGVSDPQGSGAGGDRLHRDVPDRDHSEATGTSQETARK